MRAKFGHIQVLNTDRTDRTDLKGKNQLKCQLRDEKVKRKGSKDQREERKVLLLKGINVLSAQSAAKAASLRMQIDL